MSKVLALGKSLIVPLIGGLLAAAAAYLTNHMVGPPALYSFIVLFVREADLWWMATHNPTPTPSSIPPPKP